MSDSDFSSGLLARSSFTATSFLSTTGIAVVEESKQQAITESMALVEAQKNLGPRLTAIWTTIDYREGTGLENPSDEKLTSRNPTSDFAARHLRYS